jgi:hypothetical protein
LTTVHVTAEASARTPRMKRTMPNSPRTVSMPDLE